MIVHRGHMLTSHHHGMKALGIMDQVEEDYVIISHQDSELGAEDRGPDYWRDICSYVDSIAKSLWPINKRIHDNPELGYEEHIAHEALTKFMQSQDGWTVTPSAYGLQTAWLAVYDSGRKGSVVSFNVEMGKYHRLITNPH